jgi:hypothetical protein
MTNDELTDFENEFYGNKSEEIQEQPKVETEEEVQELDEDDSLAPEDEAEIEEAEKPKKKPTFQERINQLTAKAHEAERIAEVERRERELLMRRLDELEASRENKDEPKDIREQLPEGAPNPDAKDDKGESLYPLGEFDPKFIADLTRFTIQQETKAAKEAAEQEERQKAFQEAQTQLIDEWAGKLDDAEKEIPEIRESVRSLVEVFDGIQPDYGDYLAVTVMASEVGPEIMHYFSQNIGEAKAIVAAGPHAATLALGRLEAKILNARPNGEEKSNKKLSEAPEPPQEQNRGRGGQFSVRPDTDNLDAFEKEFFK